MKKSGFNSNENGVTNPCYNNGKGCTGRAIGCHANCIPYQEFRKAIKAVHQKARYDHQERRGV